MKNIIAIAIAFLVFGCTTLQKHDENQTAKTGHVTIAYQSNRLGILEPCGCQTTPYGGLDREWNAIEAFRKENPNLIYIDSGNALFPKDVTKNVEQLKTRAQDMVRIFNRAKLDVFAPSKTDFAFGIDYLVSLKAQSEFPYVLSNVVDDKGQTLFDAYAIKTVDGIRFAFINYVPNLDLGKKYQTLDLQAVLAKQLPELKAKSDFVILVSNMPLPENEALAAKTQDIQVIIGNDERSYAEEAYVYQNGKVLMLENGNFGYFLGKLDWNIKLPFNGTSSPSQITANEAELKKWEAALEKNPNDKHAKAFYEMLKNNLDLKGVANGSTHSNQLVPLKKEIYGQKNYATTLFDQQKKQLRKKALSE